jgi:hypothetical protein
MQRLLILAGLIAVVTGLAWPLLSKLPLGRLPGDFIIDRPGLKFYLPLTTSLIVSALVSVMLWLFRR